MIRHAAFLFVHHLPALLILFINGVADVESKEAMRDELMRSSNIFSHALASEHNLVVRRAAKGFCIVAELVEVRRLISV